MFCVLRVVGCGDSVIQYGKISYCTVCRSTLVFGVAMFYVNVICMYKVFWNAGFSWSGRASNQSTARRKPRNEAGDALLVFLVLGILAARDALGDVQAGTRRNKQDEALGTRCRTENSDCRWPNHKLADWEASWKRLP